jgi:hypothetical protein
MDMVPVVYRFKVTSKQGRAISRGKYLCSTLSGEDHESAMLLYLCIVVDLAR